MNVLCLFAVLVLSSAVATAAPQSGAWFDRTRDGHGMDWQVVGDRLVGGLFTFEADGQPVWYQIDARIEGDDASGKLVEFRNAGGGLPEVHRQFAGLEIVQVEDASSCGDGSPRPVATSLFDVRFQIDGEISHWCLEPILPAAQVAESALSGSWFGGEEDRGWGLITYRVPLADAVLAFSTLYVYDAEGKPRWAFGGHPADASDIGSNLRFARGYCRSCPTQSLQLSPAGAARVTLVTPRNDVEYNRISLGLTYPFGSGGSFVRSERALRVLLSSPPPLGVVASREGLIEGKLETAGQLRYLGIPYAAPPSSALRWRAPQAALPRTEVLHAFQRGPSCAQSAISEGVAQSDLGARAEDCLQLNISAPVPAVPSGLPVMVWIHGGGLTQGSAVEARNSDGRLLYDNAALADDGVVAVSINYRLGPLGFLAMREFSGEHPDHPSAGNYGLLDQIAALKWVRDNISAFGGDPSRVTIFGESAGGRSVCALLTSPLARGLFHRAIIQSGACQVSMPKLAVASGNLPPAFAQGDRLVQAAGCGSAPDRRACMRALSWEDLIELAQPSIGFGREGETFGHVEDGYSQLRPPGLALADAEGAAVPLIVGINADEMTTLLAPALQPATVVAYEALVRQQVPAIANLVLALYPASSYASPTLAYADLADDISFACPARAFSLKHAAAGNSVYRYVYTYVFPQFAALGAFHGAEIGFVFGPGANFIPSQLELSQRMQRYWTRFAATGDPNGGGDPVWPLCSVSSDVAIEFNDAPRPVIADYRKDYCDFWTRYIQF